MTTVVKLPPPRHITKVELALHALRERIVSGDLKPGQRLRLEDLTVELGMSLTPIREALRLLQADRLIHYAPHRGIVVAENISEQISEIYRLRAVLEPMATELAVPLLTDEQIEELEKLHDQLGKSTAATRGNRATELNASWHWAIYSAANATFLNDFIQRLWSSLPWRTMWVLPKRIELSFVEHSRIMEAILASEPRRAADAMLAHIESGRTALLPDLERRSGRTRRRPSSRSASTVG